MTPIPVIGLEVHVRLSTRTKLFCRCRNAHDAPPNSLVCPVCLGLPGSLPVLNDHAVALAVRLGLALGSDVAEVSTFDRKTYFYPDLPRNYQITQQAVPLCAHGGLAIGSPGERRVVALEQIHLEEDAGKTLSLPSRTADGLRIDLNRAGAPLAEVVTRPELASAEDAYLFLRELRRLVRALGVGDGDMARGGLRCDANISLRPVADAAPGERVELKNLNSVRGVRRALDYEITRQGDLLARGEPVALETRGWDARRGVSYFQRAKEAVSDYCYLPEPDVPALHLRNTMIETQRITLPEFPAAREDRYVSRLGLAREVATTLCETTDVSDYFESVAARLDDPRTAANWVAGEVMRYCGETGVGLDDCPVSPEASAELLTRVAADALSLTAAKTVFAIMAAEGLDAATVIAREQLAQLDDRAGLAETVDRIVSDHAEQAARYRAGKTGVADWLVGQVMAATGGRADPALCAELVRARLAEAPDVDTK